MIVESIKLNQFRNYSSLDLSLDRGTNLFYGDNAQGKTNILEAVYLCGTTRSHRGSKDREMIRFGEEEAHICMKVRRRESLYEIHMHLRKNKAKGVAVNGVPLKKAGELLKLVNFIFFSPEDLNIVKKGPSERRRFMDMELCQLDRTYLSDLSNYNKIVMQRNKLLKDGTDPHKNADLLDVWDMQMMQYGQRVICTRQKFVEQINRVIFEIHQNLTGQKETLTVRYDGNVRAEEMEEKLKNTRDRDIRMKMSMVGPHRDDLSLWSDGMDIRTFGSQGQQRTAALSLKLAEIQLVKQQIGDTPVLLLDDVLSELDAGRQCCLLENICDIQTLVTCTGTEDFREKNFSLNKIFHVADGFVEQTAGGYYGNRN